MQSSVTAGDATTGLIQAAGDDGTYVIKTGAAGLKVNAVSYAADGTPTQLKGTTVGSAPMAVPSGSAPMFACRAWCNFDGTLTGTNAPRGGGNVTSVTRNGIGDYTVTLTAALPDTLCGLATSGMRYATNTSRASKVDARMDTATTIRLLTGYEDSYTGMIATDLLYVHLALFR